MDEFFTVKDVASKFSVSADTVRRWIRDGILKAVLISGDRNYRITQKSLEEFIEFREQEQA